MQSRPLVGRRVLKTGVSVFITALTCQLLQLPVIFAVITAIVTTEPTAADSLKKGAIRLPAATLGASFALFFDLLFGQHAFTYAIVAMLTIAICTKLKLDQGTLVATLTAVAMIPGTTDHVFIDLLTRLSGTTIGIFVSTLVNFVFLPPKFGPILVKKVDALFHKAGNEIESVVHQFLQHELDETMYGYRSLHEDLSSTYQLMQFQHDEWVYRKSTQQERRSFSYLQQKITFLQKTFAHLGKMGQLRLDRTFSEKESEIIRSFIQSMVSILRDPLHQIRTEHYLHVLAAKDLHQAQSASFGLHDFLHELFSLHQLIVQLEKNTADERRYSMEEQAYPSYVFSTERTYE